MNEQEIVKIATVAAKESTRETLTTLGFDLSRPIEVQKDVAHMRRTRRACESITAKAMATAIVVIIPATLYGIWEAFKAALKH